jgi:hypothetical protein
MTGGTHMESFLNSEGKPVVDRMIAAIQETKST